VSSGDIGLGAAFRKGWTGRRRHMMADAWVHRYKSARSTTYSIFLTNTCLICVAKTRPFLRAGVRTRVQWILISIPVSIRIWRRQRRRDQSDHESRGGLGDRMRGGVRSATLRPTMIAREVYADTRRWKMRLRCELQRWRLNYILVDSIGMCGGHRCSP
jgi:hypothetical protein